MTESPGSERGLDRAVAPSSDPPLADWPTGRLLSTAARLVEHAWGERLAGLGLTHAGLIALHLLDSGPLSQTELAGLARVEVQTMSRTLDRLERQGFLRRERDPRDGRRHVVTRTDAGVHVFQRARTLETDIFPPLDSPNELRASLLEIITASSVNRW